MQDKKELRKKFSAIRKAAKSDAKDMGITARVLLLEAVANADTVLLYASFRSEPDTWALAGSMLKNGKTVAYPLCGENSEMTFRIVDSISQLRDGKYDISEPDSSLPCPVITDRTVCIVPGLAFTENGERLGYGGGYYDRFLEKYPQLTTVALAYEATITQTLPSERHDATVKYIVTEERTVLCNE